MTAANATSTTRTQFRLQTNHPKNLHNDQRKSEEEKKRISHTEHMTKYKNRIVTFILVALESLLGSFNVCVFFVFSRTQYFLSVFSLLTAYYFSYSHCVFYFVGFFFHSVSVSLAASLYVCCSLSLVRISKFCASKAALVTITTHTHTYMHKRHFKRSVIRMRQSYARLTFTSDITNRF